MWPFDYLAKLNAGSGNGMGTGMLRGGLYDEMRYVRIVRLESKMFSGGGSAFTCASNDEMRLGRATIEFLIDGRIPLIEY